MPAVETRLMDGLVVEVRGDEAVARLDEPTENGGTGTGLTPSETLLAALTGCAALTLKLYAQRKQWPLTGVRIRATLERPPSGAPDPTQKIVQTITLEGPLDAEQRARLLEIAGKCPVHKTLQGPLALEERLA
jgi:putative redox protein